MCVCVVKNVNCLGFRVGHRVYDGVLLGFWALAVGNWCFVEFDSRIIAVEGLRSRIFLTKGSLAQFLRFCLS